MPISAKSRPPNATRAIHRGSRRTVAQTNQSNVSRPATRNLPATPRAVAVMPSRRAHHASSPAEISKAGYLIARE